MISPANDTPELTSYAMGELDPRQAAEVHELLAQCPAALSELEQIEAMTEALRLTAPIPQDRLRPEQRHAVLHPTHLPRRMAPMAPRGVPQVRRSGTLWPVMAGVMKAAAAVALAGLAYLAGRHTPIGGSLAHSTPAPTADVKAPSPASAQVSAPASALLTGHSSAPQAQPAAAERPALTIVPAPEVPLKPEIIVADAPPAAAVAPAIAAPAPAVLVAESAPSSTQAPAKTLVTVAATGPAANPMANAKAQPAPRPATTLPGRDIAFVSTTRQAGSEFALRPATILPAPVKGKPGEMFASPAPEGRPTSRDKDKDKDSAKGRAPDLYIHAWRAEVATCPWDDSRRLIRITVQLPADQPAARVDASYPLKITFDPTKVRDYRQLCERHLPAAELRSAGTHIVWYEYTPNGDTGTRENSRTIATVTLENGRFTTQPVGPFDGSKLTVVDRGHTWQSAREDFVFESSVVAWGLLLRGLPQAPKLNHQTVLTLAEHVKSPDTTGERARFIRQVQEARKAAGL